MESLTLTWMVGLGAGRESILGKDIWEAGEDVVSGEPTEKQIGCVGEKGKRDRQGSDLEGGVHCDGTASHGRWHAQILATLRVEWRGLTQKANVETITTTKDDMIKGQGRSD